MSNILGRLARLLPFRRARPVGYDLDGNRYYENPGVNGGRTKRTVEYKIARDISEYTNGERLPVQWTSWLSHTRSAPPSIEELAADMERRYNLRHNVLAIEARDRAEEERRNLLAAPQQQTDSAGGEQQHASSAFPPRGGGAEFQGRREMRGVVAHEMSRQDLNPDFSTAPKSSYEPPRLAASPSDPTAPIDPDLRQLSQRQLEKDRSDLVRQGVPLAAAAGHEPPPPPSTYKPPFVPTARRARSARSEEDEKSRAEFQRARREMQKSPLEGMMPLEATPRGAASAGRWESDGLKDSREAGAGEGVRGEPEPGVSKWEGVRAARRRGL